MTDSTSPELKRQEANTAHKFLVEASAFRDVQSCQWANSILGWHPIEQQWMLLAQTCKRWGCPYCARNKIRRLAWLTRNALPNRLMTLTVDPALHEHPRAAFDATAKQVPELIRRQRLLCSEVEYLRVTEVTKAGWPHYHLLLRSGYLPQQRIKKDWSELTGATIVDVRKVHETWSAYYYLVKYLTKLHQKTWTERHVSYSRKFFCEEDLEKMEFPRLERTEKIKQHPFEYMANKAFFQEVTQVREGVWILPAQEQSPCDPIPRSKLGLENDEAVELQPPHVSTLLPGMEDADQVSPYDLNH